MKQCYFCICAIFLFIKQSAEQNATTLGSFLGLAAASYNLVYPYVIGATEACPLVDHITDALNARYLVAIAEPTLRYDCTHYASIPYD